MLHLHIFHRRQCASASPCLSFSYDDRRDAPPSQHRRIPYLAGSRCTRHDQRRVCPACSTRRTVPWQYLICRTWARSQEPCTIKQKLAAVLMFLCQSVSAGSNSVNAMTSRIVNRRCVESNTAQSPEYAERPSTCTRYGRTSQQIAVPGQPSCMHSNVKWMSVSGAKGPRVT